jgi:hypothetical protein
MRSIIATAAAGDVIHKSIAHKLECVSLCLLRDDGHFNAHHSQRRTNKTVVGIHHKADGGNLRGL